MFWRVLLLCVLWSALQASLSPLPEEDLFELSIVHLNDFHARFEEVTPDGSPCRGRGTGCVGGFSRIYTAVHALLRTQPNAIFLNAGDNFQGTIWYNVHRWNVTQHFLNMLPTDAYTLGNHEFDHKIEGVVPFMRALNAPTVVANIDDSQEPEFQESYQKSTVVVRNGRRIGIIGAITTNTAQMSSPGKLMFLDPLSSINSEAEKLVLEQNCSVVMVLSHSGLDVDLVMAGQLNRHVGVVVGGHSHSLLYPGPAPSGEVTHGPYPTVVQRDHAPPVLIVQASAHSKYLGNLSVWFDPDGGVVQWEGKPIYLDSTIPQDPEINKEINIWKESVDAYSNRTIGSSNVVLNNTDCYTGECNIGNLVTDAMVDYYKATKEPNAWTYAAIAIINSGGIRASLSPGNITFGDLVSIAPFENRIDVGELTGAEIKECLEYAVNNTNDGQSIKQFLQVSGMQVSFNLSSPMGNRVSSLWMVCRECEIPRLEPCQPDALYRLAMPAFLADGNGGYSMIGDKLRNRQLGPVDVDVYEAYLAKVSPVNIGLQGRIHVY